MKPDVVCDIRYLPVPDQTFDIVYSSHTLEHFPWTSVDKVLKEWSRTLKVGGELRLVVPNLRFSAKRILDDNLIPEDYWVLYGEQDYAKNFHAVGFTPKSLFALVDSLGIYEDIQTKEHNIDGPPGPDSWNLQLRAVKKVHPTLENIAPEDLDVAPGYGAMWPVRIYDMANEKPPVTEEEEQKEIEIHKPSKARARKEKLLKEIKGDT